eukprot:CAMPEP_0202787648 /NCGR_PEP_ID=MMETSP1388-20130828/72956_1 /ASSEMBLY_ACC=CAM_ASM_000864 /TAXON_ID=37098 /ORGANISM="Isochrysis sp, Strain CCMP1244" /LENGTH=359 /DNA_ID=CAMNT_0049457247 /DNA_START=76 /DNA_END=1153 /DNA_ORIENTATION=+
MSRVATTHWAAAVAGGGSAPQRARRAERDRLLRVAKPLGLLLGGEVFADGLQLMEAVLVRARGRGHLEGGRRPARGEGGLVVLVRGVRAPRRLAALPAVGRVGWRRAGREVVELYTTVASPSLQQDAGRLSRTSRHLARAKQQQYGDEQQRGGHAYRCNHPGRRGVGKALRCLAARQDAAVIPPAAALAADRVVERVLEVPAAAEARAAKPGAASAALALWIQAARPAVDVLVEDRRALADHRHAAVVAAAPSVATPHEPLRRLMLHAAKAARAAEAAPACGVELACRIDAVLYTVLTLVADLCRRDVGAAVRAHASQTGAACCCRHVRATAQLSVGAWGPGTASTVEGACAGAGVPAR